MPILFGILGLIILFLLAGWFRSWQVQNYPQEKEFLNGKLPNKPAGLYHGTVENHQVSWLGKSFDSTKSRGINNFQNGSKVVAHAIQQKYPFKTYSGKGLQDKNLDVFKIDYDLPENPWWVRLILDEVVSTGDEKLLGKIHIKIFPGLSFALGYFKLEK